MSDSLQARLETRCERRSGEPVLGFYAETGERSCRWLTGGDLLKDVAAVAGGFAEHGLARDRAAVILLPSGPFSAAAVLATLQLGALPLLIAAPALNRLDDRLLAVLGHVVGRTDADLLVCPEWMDEHRGRLSDLKAGLGIVCGEAVARGGRPVTDWARPAGDAVGGLQLTSGTTGTPRICVWRQGRILAALDGMRAAMRLAPDDVCCNWTPLYHDMGLVNNFLLCLSEGVPLVLLGPRRFVGKPALWLQALSDTRSTITWAPNFGYALAAERVGDAELEGLRLGHVRSFWNAAERIHAETFERFLKRFSRCGVRAAALSANFGCAENVGGATFGRPGTGYAVERVDATRLQQDGVARAVDGSFEGAAERIVSCGLPCPGMRIEILSPSGERLPDGRVGEVALETPSRFSGYLGDDDATARAIHGDLMKTGDLGYRRQGQLFWVGRTDERLTIRGRKLDPSDFESTLAHIAGLRKGCFAAFEATNPDEGTRELVIVTEVRSSTSRAPREIRGEIRRTLSLAFGVPIRDVLLVRERTLTKTTSGKRRHLHFKRLYAEGGAGAFDTIAD